MSMQSPIYVLWADEVDEEQEEEEDDGHFFLPRATTTLADVVIPYHARLAGSCHNHHWPFIHTIYGQCPSTMAAGLIHKAT